MGSSPRVSAAKTSKSKFGCTTCRVRRVKCGEERPICLRCEKGGFQCRGYPNSPPPRSAERRILLPRQSAIPLSHASSWHSRSREAHPVQPTLAPVTIQCSKLVEPSINVFTSQIDSDYFQRFRYKVTRNLTGFADTSVWNRLVLQACMTDSDLRNIVIAIGALDITIDNLKEPQGQLATQHHDYALRSYSKAISAMRVGNGREPQSLRRSLLTTLAIFCFESLHGDNALALTQIRVAFRLLEAWISDLRRYELVMIEKADSPPRTMTSSRLSRYNVGIRSPAPHVVEDDLIQAYSRLDMALIFSDKTITLEDHVEGAANTAAETLGRTPEKFTSLKEAGIYMNTLIRRNMHFILACRSNTIQYLDPGSSIPGRFPPRFDFCDVGFYHTGASRAFKKRCLEDVNRWRTSYETIYRATLRSGDTVQIYRALIMRLQNDTAAIGVTCFDADDQLAFDDFYPLYDELVRLAAILLGEEMVVDGNTVPKLSTPSFAFDVGIIAPMMFVAHLCRHPTIRRRAAGLLLGQSWREGVWDSLMAGTVSGLIIAVEEEGAIDGKIPPQARVRGTKTAANLIHRNGIVTCYLAAGIIEEEVSWPFDTMDRTPNPEGEEGLNVKSLSRGGNLGGYYSRLKRYPPEQKFMHSSVFKPIARLV